MAAFSRAADPGWAAGLSRHLLLLPQSLLSGVFFGSAGVRGRRTARIATIAAKRAFRSSCRICIAIFFICAIIFLVFCGMTRSSVFLLTEGNSALASARWFCW